MLYPNTKVIAVYSTDLKTLSAQYLIEHMNTAFDTWKKHPWLKNIDFETFCKYILPYTTENCYGKESDSFFKEKYKDIDKIMHETVLHCILLLNFIINTASEKLKLDYF